MSSRTTEFQQIQYFFAFFRSILFLNSFLYESLNLPKVKRGLPKMSIENKFLESFLWLKALILLDLLDFKVKQMVK